MDDSKYTLNKQNIILLLYAYIVGIFIWDNTIVYRIVLLLMTLVTFMIYKEGFVKRAVFSSCYGILIVYFLLHTLCGFSVDNSVSYDYLTTMVINLAAIMVCIRLINTRATLHTVMKVCIVVTFMLCVYILVMDRAAILSGALGSGVKKPFTGGAYSHNDIAMEAAVSVLFLSYFRIERIKIPFNKVLIVFFSSFVLLTGARKSLILVVFGLIIFPFVFCGERRIDAKKIGKILIAIVLVLLIFYMLLNNQLLYDVIGHRFAGYFSGLVGGDFEEGSAAVRNVMKQTAIKLIAGSPLIGYGLNAFRLFPGSYGTWSHNNYMELWVSGGGFFR